MKATIIKVPSRHMIVMGKGDNQTIEYAATAYQAIEKANSLGATSTTQGDHECLKYTPSELGQEHKFHTYILIGMSFPICWWFVFERILKNFLNSRRP
jgi:hypothetical protein